MSRFNVRAISETAPPPPPPIQNKQPSAYAAMSKKGGAGSAPVISPSTGNVVVEPKKGKPTKDDIRRQKMDLADAAVVALVSNKPTRAKIREYFEGRIATLNAEKR